MPARHSPIAFTTQTVRYNRDASKDRSSPTPPRLPPRRSPSPATERSRRTTVVK